jgi:hypothetical protein
MKIIGNGYLPGRVQTEKTSLCEPADVKGFGKILKQTIDQAVGACPTSAPAASIPVNTTAPMPDHSVAGRLEGFLDLMEGYCQKLSNPRVSLKGLESSIQKLEEGRNTLSRVLGSLPDSDGIKDVLNQSLVTAEIEIIRFRRGDYFPA